MTDTTNTTEIFAKAWVKDEFARLCEPIQKCDFLYTGKTPAIHQKLEIQVMYEGTWFRMSGEITEICDPPADEEINKKEPSSLFYPRASRELLTSHYGGVHGQRIKGHVALNFDFYAKELPVKRDEVWEVDIEMNDNVDNMWIVTDARKIN